MQVRCEFCGSMIDDKLENCPNCGGVNNNIRRTAGGTPKTIEELKKWYEDRKLPPEKVTRFFIGKDYKGARAFGVYKDGSNFVVYKNKADGTRVVRYEGKDEAYAVNELYLKLKSEILNQKSRQKSNYSGSSNDLSLGDSTAGFFRGIFALLFGTKIGIFLIILFGGAAISSLSYALMAHPYLTLGLVFIPVIIFSIYKTIFRYSMMPGTHSKFVNIYPVYLLVVLVGLAIFTTITLKPTYYSYGNHIYCRYNGAYYMYDNYDYWPVEDDMVPTEIYDDPDFYMITNESEAWSSDYSFTDSAYYHDNLDTWSSSSGVDSDYDWDVGSSWDSGGTDWGSDW